MLKLGQKHGKERRLTNHQKENIFNKKTTILKKFKTYFAGK